MWQYYQKKKPKKNKNRIIAVFVIIGVLVGVYFFIAKNVSPILKTVSEEKVRALTTMAVNTSAERVMSETFNYSDIIEISKNSEGEITLIQVNTALINTIARKTVIDSQIMISNLGEQGIDVPIGSLSGMTLFAGHGPDVNIKVNPIGAVTSDFESTFTAAGVNQTKHTVKLIVTSKVNVVIPGAKQTITHKTDVILCESIIVGKVPQVYLNSSSITPLLDLIP